MFTKRHEQELAEIKATTNRLAQRFEEIVEQVERVKRNQEELAAAQRPAADSPAPTPGRKSERRRRAADTASPSGQSRGGRARKERSGARRATRERKRRRRGESSGSGEE
jgi:hypothetical protein